MRSIAKRLFVGAACGVAVLSSAAMAQQTTKPLKVKAVQEQEQEVKETTVKNNTLHFELNNLEGKKVTHADRELRGKVILVDIWGTWCPPCRAAIPHLVQLYKEYHESGLEIIGVSYESDDSAEARIEKVKKFAKENNIEYMLLDGGKRERGGVEKTLKGVQNFRGYPTMIIIGRDGKVRDVHVGFGGEKTANELREIVTELLAEPAPRPDRGEGRQFDPEQFAQRMMERFDANEDGKLSKDELPERMQEMFDDLDKNEDGALDKEELSQIRGRRGGGGRGGRGGGGGG